MSRCKCIAYAVSDEKAISSRTSFVKHETNGNEHVDLTMAAVQQRPWRVPWQLLNRRHTSRSTSTSQQNVAARLLGAVLSLKQCTIKFDTTTLICRSVLHVQMDGRERAHQPWTLYGLPQPKHEPGARGYKAHRWSNVLHEVLHKLT